ncbi:uncharacterized protein LOC116343314 [Contarinia nasturtii]|uniref:uncharacterized protein LOC116343314 n=1 Tax=Contarinia nasturtii TaxID=265458 RepID=UPI0012D3FF7C|nr:uncharacterized protein LOC116343314 [Contarinia nasturtii]
MDGGTCNASIQFGNYAYNMSGVTTEQSELKSTAIQVENQLSNGFEFANENDDEFELQDVEIIAIDPNNFYTETTSDSESSSESDDDIANKQCVNMSKNATTFSVQASFDAQTSKDDFDIITLNIDEEFPIDTHVDEILFTNDQFDLASYIGGESTSLLLSPIIDASAARRRLISISDFGHLECNQTPIKRDLSRMPVAQKNLAHDKVAKTPASNRRKRKNLSREFIETSDSDDENETSTIKNSINHVNDDSSKRKLSKDVDPVWSPIVDKRGAKIAKQQPVCRTKETVDRIDSNANNHATTKSGQQKFQGKGLRNMLKQQLLSDRPMNKGKLLKTLSMPGSIPTERENDKQPKVASHSIKRLGVGRGKDIHITAKYYNCNEPSDNCERDKSFKQDRFHQIYTDSDTDTESESDSDIEVNSEPTPSPKDTFKEKPDIIHEVNRIKKMSPENDFEKRSCHEEECVKKIADSKKISNGKSKPTVIDNSSMDSTDFAKALVTNAKLVAKKKQPISKKSNLEQQKRLIKSNILLHNPAKFKIFSHDKNKSISNSTAVSNEVKVYPFNELTERKLQPVKAAVQELPTKRAFSDKSNKCEEVFGKNEAIETVDKVVKVTVVQEITEIKDVKESDVQESVARDVLIIEESKVESSSKRKLNLQEYLKRKSLKMSHVGSGPSDGLLVNIKTEPAEGETQNQESNNANGDAASNSTMAVDSMYEEIIIVSMACNTDISIPELSFIQSSEMKDVNSVKSSVLLSDIQTSVERANSKISSMSLISSIQDVILKKNHNIELQNGKKEPSSEASHKKENNEEKPEHGENKVIMHLRKDRVQPKKVSTSVQTDPYFQFPPLEKWVPLSKKQLTLTEKRMNSIPNELHFMRSDSKNRMHRNYRVPSHLSESSYYSDEENKTIQRRSRHSDFIEHNTVRRRRQRRESSHYSSSKYDRYSSRHRTISRSLSSSSNTSTTSTDSSTTSQSSSSSDTYVSSASPRSLNSYGGSSSKSYYGDDQQYYRKRTTSNNSRRSNYRHMPPIKRNNSPEERRIVYVGRIEEETTKEELRRKFSVYGQIKNVSIHYKQTKMRYGFITFLRPADAYTAIDDSSKNPAIRHYDISFGGRRAFCREKYFDLDNTGFGFRSADTPSTSPQKQPKDTDDSFDVLLRRMKEKLQENKK